MAKLRITELIEEMAAAQEALLASRFLAPRVGGGAVRASVGGLAYTFAPEPADFEGWGIFVPASASVARLAGEADLPLVERYLSAFPRLRLRLAAHVAGRTWFAHPVNLSDARQRFNLSGPLPVHLVTGAVSFDQVVARAVGGMMLFGGTDYGADPVLAERLRAELAAGTATAGVRVSGLTPEARTCYALALGAAEERRAREREARRRAQEEAAQREVARGENRLREALALAGGELQSWVDIGDAWRIDWETSDGESMTSTVSKRDLTVVQAGICLSGEDRKFDLQTLVRVVENRPYRSHYFRRRR